MAEQIGPNEGDDSISDFEREMDEAINGHVLESSDEESDEVEEDEEEGS